MLRLRLITGTVLVATLLLVSFVPNRITGLVLLGAVVLMVVRALREYFDLCDKAAMGGFPRVAIAGAVALVVVAALGPSADALNLETVVVCGVLLLAFGRAMQCDDLREGVSKAFVTIVGVLCFGWCLSYAVRLYFFPYESAGPVLFFYFVLVTKSGDIGGYFLGKLSSKRKGGNHKLIPRLSPGKSWEGLVGSMLLSGFLGGALAHALADDLLVNGIPVVTLVGGFGVGVVLALVGLAGDLVESAIKRAAGEKDSGAIAPGMGGVYDVIDSVIFAAPLFYAWAARSL